MGLGIPLRGENEPAQTVEKARRVPMEIISDKASRDIKKAIKPEQQGRRRDQGQVMLTRANVL